MAGSPCATTRNTAASSASTSHFELRFKRTSAARAGPLPVRSHSDQPRGVRSAGQLASEQAGYRGGELFRSVGLGKKRGTFHH
jgi:hypothetical protein